MIRIPELNDPVWLTTKYNIEGLSCQEIGNIFNVRKDLIRKRLIKHGIKLRDKNDRIKPPKHRHIDYSIHFGTKQGDLEIIGQKGNRVLCQCKCGNNKIMYYSRFILDNQRSCGCLRRRKRSEHTSWRGGKYVSMTQFSAVEYKAKERNIEFNLKISEIDQLFENQNGICKLSGIPISFADNTASVDRIDSTRGYDVDNIQLVHKFVNVMKWDFSQEEFVDWCRKIVGYADSQPSLKNEK